jgi:hypothetical protein
MMDDWDKAAAEEVGRFLTYLRRHQEAVWAVVSHGHVVVKVNRNDWQGEYYFYAARCWLHLPQRFREWWDSHENDCWEAIAATAETIWGWTGDDLNRITFDWQIAPPPELADFGVRHPDPSPLTEGELAQRARIAVFLRSASEDEFTARLVVPLFQRLGFERVTATGHAEKTLEYGKDLWMRYQLPTGHWVYFAAQVKRGKIDAGRDGGSGNVGEVLSQAKMAIEHPIFDPDTGRNVLLDHMYIIASGDITRSAQNWLIGHLDSSQRRHIIFMDRNEFLNHSARILVDVTLGDEADIDDPFA